MANRSIKKRLDDLENKQPERPMIPIYQDWDDPDLWHPGDREADPIRGWDQAEAKYKDYVIFQVTYIDNWREVKTNDKKQEFKNPGQ